MNFLCFKILLKRVSYRCHKLRKLPLNGKREGKVGLFNDGDSRFHDYKKILMKQ